MLSIEASESPFQSRSENPRRQLWSPKFFQWVTIKNGFLKASDCGLDRSGNRLSLDDDAYHKRACRIVLQIRPHIIEGRRISRHRLSLVVILHRRDSYYRRTEDWSFVPSQVTFDDNSVSVHTFSLQYMIEAHTDRSNRFLTSITLHHSPWQQSRSLNSITLTIKLLLTHADNIPFLSIDTAHRSGTYIPPILRWRLKVNFSRRWKVKLQHLMCWCVSQMPRSRALNSPSSALDPRLHIRATGNLSIQALEFVDQEWSARRKFSFFESFWVWWR